MFVPCPHCQFLVAHHPQLRPLPADCPRCGRPLQEDNEPSTPTETGTDARHELDSTDVPVLATMLSTTDGADGTTQAGIAAVADATPADAGDVRAGIDAEGGPAMAQETEAAIGAAPAPGATFAARKAPRRGAAWRWPLIAVLALLLVLQILLADRARLAADPRWRPLVEGVCATLGCALPPWHEPAAFTMLDRKVRPAAPASAALRVDATFRNDARWAQAWPPLQLSLSDADGRVLGSRVFQPQEYLGAAPSTLLSPGQSAQITFVVQEPASGTVAFAFEFR